MNMPLPSRNPHATRKTVRPKPLDEQVVVITAASSGIGLATARLAARRGARLVLTALVFGLLDRVQVEPATGPWFGTRLNRRVFEIFGTFPNEAERRAHLSGVAAALLKRRSNDLLAWPARIARLDVLGVKD